MGLEISHDANLGASAAVTRELDKICMIVLNEVLSDGRVMRAASALAKQYDVEVLGWLRPERKAHFDHQAAQSLGFKLRVVELRWTARLPKNTFGYLARYAELALRLVRLGHGIRPWAIHAHESSGLPIGYLIAKLSRAKLVYDAHELYRDSMRVGGRVGRCIGAWLETFLMRRCADIIACNAQRAEIMLKEYGAPCLPKVVRNLPPYAELAPASPKLRDFVRARNPDIDRIIVHTGAIVGRCEQVVISAMAKVPDNVGLVLTGYESGNASEEITALLRRHRLEQRVLVHPRVPYEELGAYIRAADLGLVYYPNTNRNYYYCAPSKLHEFAMAGLPIVAVDFPPCREFLLEYHYGRLFCWDDSDELARAMIYCLADEERYRDMRAEALRAARDVNWDREQDRLLQLYKDLQE